MVSVQHSEQIELHENDSKIWHVQRPDMHDSQAWHQLAGASVRDLISATACRECHA